MGSVGKSVKESSSSYGENNLNIQEILKQQYLKIFNALHMDEHRIVYKTMKQSNIKFYVEDNEQSTVGAETIPYGHRYTVKFLDVSFDFGYGNWSSFDFATGEGVGKFLFETGANGGVPIGTKEVLDYSKNGMGRKRR